MNKIILIALSALILCLNAKAQTISGVYQVESRTAENTVLAKGTGFIVQSFRHSSYIATSFHLLNGYLLEADSIYVKSLDGEEYPASIVAYDELKDIMILSVDKNIGESYSYTKKCNGDLTAIGFVEDELFVQNAKIIAKALVNNVYKIDAYLPKGFSGSPILNSNAEVCAMVLLSSVGNSNSIVVAGSSIKQLIESNSLTLSTPADVRVSLGVEFNVKNQNQLNNVLANTSDGGQIIINIEPEDSTNLESDFIVTNANNMVFKSSKIISRFTLQGASNIMLKGLKIKKDININNSLSVSVVTCDFNGSKLKIQNSRDVFISGNKFNNINQDLVLADTLQSTIKGNYSNL